MLHRSLPNMDIDEIAIADQVIATHDPNEGKDLNAIFVLNFAENILNLNVDIRQVEKDILMLQEFELRHQLLQLSSEVAFKSLSDTDCHSSAIYLLSMLSTYSWVTKVVMMLATFAIIYGKVIIISRQCCQKNLTNKLALLNKRNLIVTPSYNIEKLLDNSIKSTIDLVKCVVELNPPSSSSPPQPVILASYWITRSILAYVQHIFDIESQNKVIEGSTLIVRTKSILTTCCPLLEEKRTEKSYEALLDAFSNSSNNLEVLKLIFNVKDDDNKVAGYFNKPVQNYGLHRLENDRLLLIVVSSTNVSVVDFLSRQLRNIKYDTRIIWIPIIDDVELWTNNMQLRLSTVNHYGSMVLDPRKSISSQFIRFIKKRYFSIFQSGEDPIVISLENHGKLVHTNALHMMLTWRRDLEHKTNIVDRGNNIIPLLKKELTEMTLGVDPVIHNIEKRISDLVVDIDEKINDWRHDINAEIEDSGSSYNYTSKKEKEFWDKETWSLKFFVRIGGSWKPYDIDKVITNWIEEKNYIFLYGGDDAKCLQEFVTKVKEVNSKTQLNIKLAYMGKSKKVKLIVEKISDYALISSDEYWWFWTRLRSMFLSRINYLNGVGHDQGEDKIIRGLQKLLAYETKGTTVGGWILLSKGEEVVVCDLGDKMLKVMNEYQKWRDNVHNKGFSQAFKDCYEMLVSSSKDHHSCCTLEYPCTLDKIPKDVECPQCSRDMHKFVTFTCCHDQYIWN